MTRLASVLGWLGLWVVVSVLALPGAAEASPELVVWHAYRGAEETALREAAERWNSQNMGMEVRLLPVPYDAFANRLTSAIPRGHGPDLFIAAHERAADWERSGLLRNVDGEVERGAHHPVTIQALEVGGKLLGVPLAFKGLALFYNTELIEEAPATTEELLEVAGAYSDSSAGRYGLVYEAANFYMHLPWLVGFGGEVFAEDGSLNLATEGAAASLRFADLLVNQEELVPREATSALVAHLFSEGLAPMAISGPWFLGEIGDDMPFDIAPLPVVSETGLVARPFMTVEAAFISAYSEHGAEAVRFAEFLASEEIAVLRALRGLQSVSTLSAYDDPLVGEHRILSKFRQQLDQSVPMPNDPRMRSVWEPATRALNQVLRGTVSAEVALEQAERRIALYTREPPAPKDPKPLLIGLLMLGLGGLSYGAYRFRRDRVWARMKRAKYAYFYLAPAVVGMGVLVLVPFVVGSAVSLFAHQNGEFTYVGLANFIDIIGSREYGLTDPHSFYFTLAVTVLWTAVNIILHVSIGLGLALLLRDPWMKLRGFYRVLLIIPWAIPNYITALIWKGMFHRQFGAINGALEFLGVPPVSWFSQFSTAFAANVATNAWLGFPFMMVVTLGALQAIPRDLEEAAAVDGASRWQRFRHVTWPLLKPALVPAVVLGTVWTFNMFNIIYLVSGGAPEGSTEILISEAYKWAFDRQEQYGYAAAYAVLIFFVLLGYGLFSGQLKTGESGREQE